MRLSWPKRWQKKTHLSRELLLYSPKDFFISFLLYAASVFVCLILRHFDTSKATSYVAMIFLLDVFLTAFFTDGFLFSLLDAVLGVLSVDYIFTEPYWHISFTLSGVPVTFLVMMTISILTGILTSRAKQLDAVSREAEREKLYAGLLRAVSHDIRTPLTGIVGATNVLLEQEETITPAQRHELLQSANQEAQWLIRIVENLLSITRIGAENACVTKTPEAAEEVIEGAVAKFRRRWPAIDVSVHLPDEFLLVPMDPLLIEQVLTNLLENAALHGETTTHIDISLERIHREACFTVADNGVGLPPELQARIFNGYFCPPEQGDKRRNMGIGLSACQAGVRAHQGRIAARSSKQGGAVFQVYLPMKEEPHENQG